ncbi:MAG: hypothetical protein SFU99_09995 [Saprospiraceae bacterium]|nr:hypothetical protein [Saprospiraceae bacterium]
MKTIQLSGLLFLAMLIPFVACEDDSNEDFAFQFDFNFATSQNGWTGDFADYPVGEEDFYELRFSHDALPAPLDKTKKALKINGNNHSDDLFMFVKNKLTGLAPNTEYSIEFEFELASQYPENSAGVGGSPGAGSYLKAGASASEPKKVATEGFYELNLDKGNQSQAGDDAIVIGTLGISGDQFVYKLINRDNDGKLFKAKTDAEGNLWVYLGVDSAFEGITTFYVTKATIRLK